MDNCWLHISLSPIPLAAGMAHCIVVVVDTTSILQVVSANTTVISLYKVKSEAASKITTKNTMKVNNTHFILHANSVCSKIVYRHCNVCCLIQLNCSVQKCDFECAETFF